MDFSDYYNIYNKNANYNFNFVVDNSIIITILNLNN